MKKDANEAAGVSALTIIYEKEGEFMQQHVHAFDHVHLVGQGKIKIEIHGQEPTIHSEGELINIKAGLAHKLSSVTPHAVSFCIRVLRKDERGGFEKFAL